MSEINLGSDQVIADRDTHLAISAMLTSQANAVAQLAEINAGIQGLIHLLRPTYDVKDKTETAYLGQNMPYRIDRHGRRYALLFTPAAITGITTNILGHSGSLSLPAGWTVLNEPDGATLTMTGTSATVIIRYTNWLSGSSA
jgi:hypothetical protein